MKLEPFGIEIYAAIDGYSRFIVWIYVGVSARTAISVHRQYLDCVFTNGFIPLVMRADLGTETIIVGDAHLALRQSLYTNDRVSDAYDQPSNTHHQVFNTDIQLSDTLPQFKDCFFYGRSVENQRIEGWWSQLAASSVFLYHEYFNTLQQEGIFSKQCIPEQVRSISSIQNSINSYLGSPSCYIHANSSQAGSYIYKYMEHSSNSAATKAATYCHGKANYQLLQRPQGLQTAI
jgi:hypothetical protein